MIPTKPKPLVNEQQAAPGHTPLSPKRSSRRAKLIEMLVAPVVVAEDAPLLERQTENLYKAFKPRNEWQDWLTGTIATIMLRINRCERIERKLRDWASYRAIDFWEDDRKLAAEVLGSKLARDPAKVVAGLGETLAGLDWLVTRWRGLARIEPANWTDAQRGLASDLLGGVEGIDPSAPGFARDRVEGLEAHRERVEEADAIARGLVEADLNDAAVPNLAGLRRYSRSLHRQLKWYVDQFHVEHPDRWDDPRRRPASYGPVVENLDSRRPLDRDRFEGASTVGDETKPFASVADTSPRNDETKPTRVETSQKNDETKPFSVTEPAVRIGHLLSQPSKTSQVIIQDYANERGKHHSRPRLPGETSGEYARRQKAARRRTNLALTEMV